MKNRLIPLFWISLYLAIAGCAQQHISYYYAPPSGIPGPDKLYGELFHQVQMSGIYSDSKTFVDSIPRHSPAVIMAEYHESKHDADFDLQSFVQNHFTPPPNIASGFRSDSSRSVQEHINVLWDVLTRTPDDDTSAGTLLPLPHPYIVPGGRFREVYYWDSYFTMLGLQESERWDLVENMVDNFSYLVDTLGFIPNGNRTYYQSRSQPPFFSLMVKLLQENKGEGTLAKYRPQLLKEYRFWMDGTTYLDENQQSYRRVVRLDDGAILNRYWDDLATPRPESYREDVELVRRITNDGRGKEESYRHIRAAAESGWDFSSRWFKDGEQMKTIHTTEIIPVDLNSLLYHLELVLAEAYEETGESAIAEDYRQLAEDRKTALMRCCWSESEGFFRDYDFVRERQTEVLSLAAAYPLFFNIANKQQAAAVARLIEDKFLQTGGVTTTLRHTGQQWDAPNGWAPLQWITIRGLNNYGHHSLADTIESRWEKLNKDVYERSGKMVEKYNVYETGLEAGGGEYPVQDGFGWTNGVLLKLLKE